MAFSYVDETGVHTISTIDSTQINLVPITVGSTVIQSPGRYSPVTINTAVGVIVTSSASFNGTVPFTVNNSTVLAGTTIVLSIGGGQTNTGTNFWVSGVSKGAFQVTCQCLTGNETGAISINFAVKRAALSIN